MRSAAWFSLSANWLALSVAPLMFSTTPACRSSCVAVRSSVIVACVSSMVWRSAPGISRVSLELAIAVTLFIMSVADFSSSSIFS